MTGLAEHIRALDWHFLVPYPEAGHFRHLIVLGGPEGLAERIREAGLAQCVSREIVPGISADAVAVLPGARTELRKIAQWLAPTGVLYYEVDRRSAGCLTSTPRRMRQALRQVGLTPTGVYAAGRTMYLPLDVPGALRWYVTNVYPTTGPTRCLLELGLRVVTGLDSRRLARLTPRFAVTAVGRQARSTRPSVLGHPSLPPELRRDGLRPLMFLGEWSNRVTMLPFGPADSRPVAVLKVPRLPSFNRWTESEQRVLADVRQLLDPHLQGTLPVPLGVIRWRELSVAVQSYKAGACLSRTSGRWGGQLASKVDDLRLAAGWLTVFHARTQVRRTVWGESELSQWVTRPFIAYRQAFGGTDGQERLFAETERYAGSLTGSPLPIVWQHRDYSVWNVFRSGHELSVLDWEKSRIGPALCDLLRFVTDWNDSVRRNPRGAESASLRQLFLEPRPQDAVTTAVHEVMAQYMRRLGMDPRFLPLLLVHTWVERALLRFHRQRTDGAQPDARRPGNQHVSGIAVLAEHAHQLFGCASTYLLDA